MLDCQRRREVLDDIPTFVVVSPHPHIAEDPRRGYTNKSMNRETTFSAKLLIREKSFALLYSRTSMAEGEPLNVIWDDLTCPKGIMFVHNAAKLTC